MKEIRCFYCGKLLCKIKGKYELEIKCNKCKQINHIKECQEHQSK